MPFKKGISGNPSGRPPGTGTGQYANQIKQKLGEFIVSKLDLVIANFDKLKPNQQWQVIADVLNYYLARQRSVELSGEVDMIDRLTDEQAKGVSEELGRILVSKLFADKFPEEMQNGL